VKGRGWRRWLAAGPGLCFLGFLGGFGALMAATDMQVLFRGPTVALLWILALPLSGAALLGAQLALFAPGPVGERRWWRAIAVANLFLGALFLLWLDYWNLLGYRLG